MSPQWSFDNEVVIARRFRGPDQSANGGYCSGLVAEGVRSDEDAAVEVTLRAPPPLDQPLRLHGDGSSAELLDQDRLLATARSLPMPTLELPVSCGREAAEAAARAYVGHQHHPYPGCFVCGPQRDVDDGLRIFAGDGGIAPHYAAPWTPDASLVGADGVIDRRMVWAALDCPSYFALGKPGLPALLGRMTAQISALPDVGERCVLMAWAIDQDGRKHRSASALYGEDGRLLAHALLVWIELAKSESQ